MPCLEAEAVIVRREACQAGMMVRSVPERNASHNNATLTKSEFRRWSLRLEPL